MGFVFPHLAPWLQPPAQIRWSLSPIKRGLTQTVVLTLELEWCPLEGLVKRIAGPTIGVSDSGLGPETLHFEPVPR